MKTRIISGVGLSLVFGSLLVLGYLPLLLILMFVSACGMMELNRILGTEKSPMAIVGYAGCIVYYCLIYFGLSDFYIPALAMVFLLQMAMYVFAFPKYNAEAAMMSFFSFAYAVVMVSFLYSIRSMENGLFFIWLVFICSWVADTFAYFVGVFFGKHKMVPKLSPKKTWEGAVGGIAGSLVVGFIYGMVFASKMNFSAAPYVFPIACAVGGVISIIGDLTASAIKRDHNVKDYGKLIPGHGGIMDRFDSVIVCAPIIYLVLYLFTNFA